MPACQSGGNFRMLGYSTAPNYDCNIHTVYVPIFKNTTFSVQYTMFRGSDLTRTRNANLSAPVPTVYPEFTAAGIATGGSFTVLRFSNPRPLLGRWLAGAHGSFQDRAPLCGDRDAG